jgi:hypothetical protein
MTFKKFIKIILFKNKLQSSATCIFGKKKAYELKGISFVQQDFIKEYPNDGTPSYSVFKNILSNFEKYGLVKDVPPKHKILGQKPVLEFSLIVNQESDICCCCLALTSVSHL